MTDPLTTNMQFAVPTRGSDAGTWDVPMNGDWTITDNAFGSVGAIALTSSPVTLSVSQAQNAVLRFSGTITTNITVTLPAIVKFWTVENNTVGAFVVTLTTGSGNVVGLPPGEPVQVYSDGTNVKFSTLDRTGKIDLWYASGLPAWVTACSVLPYLVCDGTTFNATTYAALNTFLGGNTLPDLRGRSPFMLNLGTNRVTTGGSGIDGDTLGANGGQDTQTLGSTQIPTSGYQFSGNLISGITASSNNGDILRNPSGFGAAVSGPVSGGLGTGTVGGFTITSTVASFTPGGSVSVPGGGQPHNNMAPTLISGVFVIKT